MIRPIMKDPIFLAQKSAPATEKDLPAAQDLMDTLHAHREDCVGMAANMIGVLEIVKCFRPYGAEEGCLSLTGVRRTKHCRSIKVRCQNGQFQTRLRTFTGWTAQIIQHEIDHCNGVLI